MLLSAQEREIPESNLGSKMLRQMGWTPGTGLGKEGDGRVEPVRAELRKKGVGLGHSGDGSSGGSGSGRGVGRGKRGRNNTNLEPLAVRQPLGKRGRDNADQIRHLLGRGQPPILIGPFPANFNTPPMLPHSGLVNRYEPI